MTPKEKAKELMANFIVETLGMPTLSNKQAKQCAALCIQEIIEAVYAYDGSEPEVEYWESVKTELNSL